MAVCSLNAAIFLVDSSSAPNRATSSETLTLSMAQRQGFGSVEIRGMSEGGQCCQIITTTGGSAKTCPYQCQK